VDLLLIAVIAVIALALLFDFSNGFHDAANSVATVVATRAMPPKVAVGFSAFFNFLAYFFVGTAVANTVSKVVDAQYAGVAVVFAALVGAISWNYLTWWLGMPSSSSHALLGGLVGAGLAAGWLDAISWTKVEEAAIAVFASPLVAFSIAFVAMYFVAGLQRVTGWADNARPFKVLQIISAAAVSFGHGANDAQKTMGVIAALLAGAGYTTMHADGTVPVPEWVALSAYAAIALGTMWGGWKSSRPWAFGSPTCRQTLGWPRTSVRSARSSEPPTWASRSPQRRRPDRQSWEPESRPGEGSTSRSSARWCLPGW
jgi:PiT family inorganic phosphate transporter